MKINKSILISTELTNIAIQYHHALSLCIHKKLSDKV